jgi:hypothetical protein
VSQVVHRPWSRRLWLALAFAVVGALMAALAAPSPASAGGKHHPHRQIAKVKQATAKYHHAKVALRHGYVSTVECVFSPEGAMGIHFVNSRLLDQRPQAKKPEALLYLPTKHGLKLVGVEYLVVDADQDLSTNDHPRVLGQAMHGPIPGHDGLPVHYALHAWVWDHNPSGLFYDWNPSIRCPGQPK